MENKIISIDITPDNSAEYTANAGVMWEHNATVLKFNIDSAFVGDYRYYIEYRSLMGTKVRTEYLELNTEDNTVTYNVPVTMSSLKGAECFFNIVSIDDDGNTVQVIKPKKFCLSFDYSPDTDNQLCKVNDFSINALLEAIRLGTFKGEKGDKGEPGEKGEKGDKGDRGDDGEVTTKYVNKNFANALKGTVSGALVSADDVSPIQHELKCSVVSKNLFDISKVKNTTATNKLVNNGDGTLTIKGGTGLSGSEPNTLKDYAPSLKVGETYTLSAETTSSKKYIFLKGEVQQSWAFGTKRVITEADLNAPVGWYSSDADTTDIISNIQIEIGSTATEYTPYVETSTVTVIRTGKNLFDISKVKNTTATNNLVNNGDGVLTIVGGTGLSGLAPNTLKDYAPSLKVGETYTLSAETTSTKKYIFLKGEVQQSWAFGTKRVITEADLNASVGWYSSDNITTDTISNIQIELGATATEYEEYNEQSVAANADGTVDGILSVSPNMVVTPDIKGVIVTCEYNKDTNKVIENLVNAIVSLGGNV